MGLGIFAYRVRLDISQGNETVQYPGQDQYIFEVVDPSEWKSESLSGRQAFVAEDFWEHGDAISEEMVDYQRVKNFSRARSWVDAQDLPDGNKDWMHRLIDLMARDKTVWARLSW